MAESRSTAAHASVIYLRIREFSRAPVAKRAELKSRLEGAVTIGNSALADDDRIVLDAPDGIAVVVLGDPLSALAFANRSMEAARDVSVAAGINHGPVRVVQDGAAGEIMVGDGISVAAAIADFADPGRVLASRSFRDFLGRLAPDRGRHLLPAGMFTDLQDRSHELFFADAAAAKARRRRYFVLAMLGAAGIVGLGLAGRYTIQSRRPALVELEILPQGDVLVDGVLKGKAPPLTRLQLAPGKHTIEVRNPRFKPLVVEVDVKAGEQLSFKHSFTAPSNPKPAKRGFFDWFK